LAGFEKRKSRRRIKKGSGEPDPFFGIAENCLYEKSLLADVQNPQKAG